MKYRACCLLDQSDKLTEIEGLFKGHDCEIEVDNCRDASEFESKGSENEYDLFIVDSDIALAPLTKIREDVKNVNIHAGVLSLKEGLRPTPVLLRNWQEVESVTSHDSWDRIKRLLLFR